MKTLMIFGYLMLISMTIAVKYNKKVEETFIITMFIDIITLYVCGLIFKDLRVGAYICVLYAVLCFIYLMVNAVRNSKIILIKIRNNIFTPGLLLYIILFVYIYYANVGRIFTGWDEFSHWGLVYKNMVLFNRFGNYQFSTVHFPGYPPATALWEYYICKLYRGFLEEYAYRAFGWLIIALVVPIASKFSWKRICAAALFTLILLLMPTIFNVTYIASLYVDVILGMLFGFLLCQAIDTENHNTYYFFSISLGMMMLCLIKASGAFLAILVGGVMILESLKQSFKQEQRMHNILKPLACTAIALLIGKYSWNIYLKLTNTSDAWNTSNITVNGIFDLVSGKGKEYQYQVLKNFHDAIWNTDLSAGIIQMKYIHWIILCILGLLVISFLNKDIKNRIKIYNASIIVGMIIYTIGLLFLYVFTFKEIEAVNIASFTRYIPTYIIGILYYILWLYARVCSTPNSQFEYKYLECLLVCFFSLFFQFSAFNEIIINNRQNISLSINKRNEDNRILLYTNQLNYKKDKVSIISQHDNGFDKFRLAYLITPVRDLDAWYWSLGEPNDSNDLYTQNISPSAWLEMLIENDTYYVYLYNIDDRFIEDYGDCFTEIPKNKVMYHLIKSDDSYKLVPVSLK